MGSGTSRGKKVAPACISELDATKTATRVTLAKQDSRPFKPLKIHAILRNARNRAEPPERHGETRNRDISEEDDDDDGELGRVVANYEERESVCVKKPTSKKTFLKPKTYGLCHFSREDAEDDFGSPRPRAAGRAEEPRGSGGGSGDVNKRSSGALTHFKTHTSDFPGQHSSSAQGFMTRGVLLEAVPTSEKHCFPRSSLTMPVILYDGSEEELMDTIEREFS